MARMRATLRLVRPTGWSRRSGRREWLLIPAFLLAGMVGGTVLGLLPEGQLARIIERPATQVGTAVAGRQFAACSGGTRINCVVDGDTFWLDGTRIRIADINTPEVGSPACPVEATLGRRAAARLGDLLNAGPFELARIDRDEDVYGRKLRIVMRDGRSVGETLVAEGLAHRWAGRREDWC